MRRLNLLMVLEVYAGQLSSDREVCGDENPLLWVSVREDYSDSERLAGCGSIGHIMAHIAQNRL